MNQPLAPDLQYLCVRMTSREMTLSFSSVLFIVGIKCKESCKKWLEQGHCSTRWRNRCIRTCLALGCEEEPVRPAGENLTQT